MQVPSFVQICDGRYIFVLIWHGMTRQWLWYWRGTLPERQWWRGTRRVICKQVCEQGWASILRDSPRIVGHCSIHSTLPPLLVELRIHLAYWPWFVNLVAVIQGSRRAVGEVAPETSVSTLYIDKGKVIEMQMDSSGCLAVSVDGTSTKQ